MDWFVVLAPLLLLPVVVLFAFVGCLDGEESLGSVTGWDQAVILAWSGLPANADQLTFTCRLTTQTTGVSETRNPTTTPPLIATDKLTIKLPVSNDDMANGMFHCVGTCTLSAGSADLMDPDPNRRTILKDFPPGQTAWHFDLVPSSATPGKFQLS